MSLGLTGREVYTIEGTSKISGPGGEMTVRVQREDGSELIFQVNSRIDTPIEVEYYRNGGILHTVLYNLLKENRTTAST